MSEPSHKKVEELKRVLAGKKEEAPKPPATLPAAETPANEKAANLQQQLDQAKEEAQANYDKLLRVMAEFENYKKRIARDHRDRLQYGQEMILKELLAVLDDFDRVLDHLPRESTPAVQSVADGVHLVQQHLLKLMKRHGVSLIETEAKPFDPHVHEAIAHAESGDHPEGTIVQCHRKGYLLHDRLLRPASVTVAKEKPKPANENR